MADIKQEAVAENKEKVEAKETKQENNNQQTFKPNRNNFSNNKKFFKAKKKTCQLCQRGILSVDYKDIDLLKHYVDYDHTGSILPQYTTGACTKHQRQVSNAVHRARIVALLPFIKK